MGPKDVTDRSAVLTAIREFDAVGRETFLGGLGKAHQYFLVCRGRMYDSKDRH